MVAADLRRRRPKPHTTWRLAEVYLKIDGRMLYLRRTVDAEGEVLDVLVQSKRNKHAAADATAAAQDATLQQRRLGAEIPLDPCRRLQRLQRPTPSHLGSNASHTSRRGDERVARGGGGGLKFSEAQAFRQLDSTT
jgi:hypothetical protein